MPPIVILILYQETVPPLNISSVLELMARDARPRRYKKECTIIFITATILTIAVINIIIVIMCPPHIMQIAQSFPADNADRRAMEVQGLVLVLVLVLVLALVLVLVLAAAVIFHISGNTQRGRK